MRISGGAARGARLKTPAGARPTSEHVRRAMFSSLAAVVSGARVLDLYCGSGAYGLEALSRGASSAVLVDSSPQAVSVTRENARNARLSAVVHRRDALRYLETEALREGPFDLVFCDPPYDRPPDFPRLLVTLRGAATPGGTVVIETRRKPGAFDVPDGWLLEADRPYGDTRVLVLRRSDRPHETAAAETRSTEDE